MTDEGKLTAQMARASRAQDLMKDEMLQEAFERLEANYINAWRQSKPGQKDDREILYLAINAIGKLRDELRIMLDGGKLAMVELEEINRKRSVADRVKT